MIRSSTPFVLLASLFLTTGCAQLATKSESSVLAQVSDIAVGPLQTRPSVVEFNGKPAILYSTKADRVAFQLGEQRQLLDETARVKQGASFFQLKRDQQELYALWWSHKEGKNGYLTSSTDGGKQFSTVKAINDGNGILPPLSLIKIPSAGLGVSYLDERLTGYQVYFNRSADSGLTWASSDQRLDPAVESGRSTMVYDHHTVLAGDTLVAVWADVMPNQGKTSYRILSRRSQDGGTNWTPATVIYTAEHQPTSFAVRAYGQNVVIAADEVTKGVFALVSMDQGNSWKSAGHLAGTESGSGSNSGMDMAVTQGRAHLVWMQDRQDEKTRVIRATLNVANSNWIGSAQRMDTKAFENTKSISPVILATAQGSVVSAWVDYRDIRPNIYLSVSSDQGLTWTPPQALLKQGAVSAGWPQLVTWGSQAAIAYELYPGERQSEGTFVVRSIDIGASGVTGLPLAPVLSDADKKSRLEQRIKTLWEYRVSGKVEDAYEIFDFAYKASTPRKFYALNASVITYLSFAVDSVSITGNEADVKMKVRYELKPMILPATGKPISVQPVDTDVPTKWVWVEDDWYLVYSPSFDPPMLKY